jgi:type VI secretion system protein ImpL
LPGLPGLVGECGGVQYVYITLSLERVDPGDDEGKLDPGRDLSSCSHLDLEGTGQATQDISVNNKKIYYLKHIAGSKKGQIDSFDSDRIRIGRHPDNDLAFDPEKEREVSSHHAEICREGDTICVKDHNSTNGTYVNGRRITQPTPLASGDTIQFSPHGPKVTLLTKSPSLETAMAVAGPGGAAPPAARSGPAGIGIWTLIGLGIAGLLLVAGLVYSAWSSRWILFAVLLAGTAASGGLLAWWRSGWANPIQAWRRAPRAEGKVEPEAKVEGENLKELHRKWAEALTTLRQTDQKRRSEDPIYASSWILVLGETGSGKTETIRAANPLSWLSSMGQRQETSVTQYCDWWFFDNAVLLDTAGRYSAPVSDQADSAEWREILSLLKRSRPEEPIDGVVIAVAADALVSRPPDQLQEGANQVRRRLDEIGQNLGASFPVYLLVTKMDSISGFTEFFGGLPDAVRGQAMGAVNEDLNNPAGATAFLDRAFRSVAEKLDRLRLARMDEEDDQEALRQVYLFPDEFRCLRGPLRAFAGALFRHSPYQETSILRGIFFVCARQGGASLSQLAQSMGLPNRSGKPVPAGATDFAREIFSAILPQDRPLARKTPLRIQKARRARLAGLVAAATLSLLVAGLFTLSFWRNSRLLSHLPIDACLVLSAPSAVGPLAAQLKGLDGCREVVEGLAPRSFWGRLASNFGLGQSGRIEEPLRQRYLQAFQTRILDPLDAKIDQKLLSGREGPLYVSALLQRMNLLAQCRKAEGCPRAESGGRPQYRVTLAADDPSVKDGDPRVEQLARTFEAFLRWQPDLQILEELRNKQVQRIMRWLNAGGLRADWILASASSQYPPVRSRDFWGVDTPGQVDPAFTRRAWTEGIQPLVSGLREMAPEGKEVVEALTRFEADYRREGIRQWEQLLLGFPQGEKLAAGRGADRELASRVLGPESPYWRVLDVAIANLASFLGAPVKGPDVSPWVVTLQRYEALKGKLADPQKVQKSAPEGAKAESGDQDREAARLLAAYLDALDHLRPELTTPEKAFRSAQKAFEEGEPSGAAGSYVLKAIWNRDQLRQSIGTPQGEDRLFWIIVARPTESGWRAVLDQAGLYVAQQWEALRLELTELPPGQRTARVLLFVNGPLAPFLERRRDGYATRTLLNEGLPFTQAFLAYLARSRVVPPEDLGKQEPPRQIVTSL